MAKIKFSALVSDVRNSLNGSTFARNRGGSYFRNKTTPTNPKSAPQNLVRAGFAYVSQAWRGLTEEQRLSWNEGAINFPYTDAFGDSHTLSGFGVFQKLNTNLHSIGVAINDVCPAKTAVFAPANISLIAEAEENVLALTVGPSPLPAGFVMVIEATRQVSAGKYNLNNAYRRLQFNAAGPTIDIEIASTYTQKFGALVEGQKVGVRIFYIAIATGEVSQTISVETIIQP